MKSHDSAGTPAVPVLPGTLLRMTASRDDGWFARQRAFGRPVPATEDRVLEVVSYILDREGGHVTFRHAVGTYVVFGGGRIESVKFPYPHPMFDVVSDSETARIKADWETSRLIALATHPLGRWTRWLPRLLGFSAARAAVV